MKGTPCSAVLLLLAAPLALAAQTTVSPTQPASQESTSVAPSERVLPAQLVPKKKPEPPEPLSRIGIAASISTLGPTLQVATNLNSHFNLRATGNFFTYTDSFTESGINANGTIHLASAGASLDVFPFHNGFRLSPGVLFYNQNRITATAAIPGGDSFEFNDNTYYSANANAVTGATPMTGTGYLGLHTNRPAFTATTGWGNLIPHKGGHFSFPFEIGAVFIGSPTVNATFTGWVCADQAQTMCYDFTNDPNAADARADLQTQIAKWAKDLDPLKTYPYISFGIGYNFKIRPTHPH